MTVCRPDNPVTKKINKPKIKPIFAYSLVTRKKRPSILFLVFQKKNPVSTPTIFSQYLIPVLKRIIHSTLDYWPRLLFQYLHVSFGKRVAPDANRRAIQISPLKNFKLFFALPFVCKGLHCHFIFVLWQFSHIDFNYYCCDTMAI